MVACISLNWLTLHHDRTSALIHTKDHFTMTILQVLAIGLLTSTHLSVFGSYAATPDHLLAEMASGMRWHGKIFADGPEYEFYGDAQVG